MDEDSSDNQKIMRSLYRRLDVKLGLKDETVRTLQEERMKNLKTKQEQYKSSVRRNKKKDLKTE